jgi:hypothetical protein
LKKLPPPKSAAYSRSVAAGFTQKTIIFFLIRQKQGEALRLILQQLFRYFKKTVASIFY